MPIVQINLLEGRTPEQKRALVKSVTQAICESADSTPDKVRIIINDMSHGDYAIGGVLVADAKK